jgi:LysR family transcriptional regulator, hydrogen peroxide-inducible genes activator
MNLRDLHYLVTTAETLHFGKAARACNVSQPTLSMQLKKLEDTLGVQLFERTNKHVQLTGIGADMVVRARRILAEIAQIKLAANATRDPLVGELRLGLFPTLAPYLLPSLMPLLRGAFPSLTLLLTEEKTPLLLQQLESGLLDCALLALPIADDSLTTAQLFHEPFYLAVARDHHLAARKSVRLGDVALETVLLLEDGHCLRDQALAVCHRVGVGESNNFRATSLETLRHMVASSDAVTLMPELATCGADTAMRYIPFAEPTPSRTIGLTWRKTSARTPLFEAMAKVISENYGKL